MIKHLTFLLLIEMAYLECDNNKAYIDEFKIEDDSIYTEEYQPVCECDGLTYGNDYQAYKAGLIEQAEG